MVVAQAAVVAEVGASPAALARCLMAVGQIPSGLPRLQVAASRALAAAVLFARA